MTGPVSSNYGSTNDRDHEGRFPIFRESLLACPGGAQQGRRQDIHHQAEEHLRTLLARGSTDRLPSGTLPKGAHFQSR